MSDPGNIMPQPVRSGPLMHLVGLLTTVAFPGYLLWAIRNTMPERTWVAGWLLLAGFVVFWIGLFVVRPVLRDGRWSKQRTDLRIFLAGSLMTVLVVFLAYPHADAVTRLLGLLFGTGSMAVIALATARQALTGWLADVVPFIMPTANIIFFLLFGVEHELVASAFVAIICLIIALQRNHARQLILQTQDAKRRAEMERDARLRFIASASHDLGQPLQSARLFLDQTMKGDSAAREKAARNARWAFENAEGRLRAIIDHLRLDSGSVPVQVTEEKAGSILARVVALHEPAARVAGIELRTLPSSLDVMADLSLAEQALGNLLANAIRHSGGTRVLLGVKRRRDMARLWVIDNGTGIASDDQDRLFEDYFQGSNHGDQVRGGFGLGLASAKRMAGLMGGTAGYGPRWTRGSAFYLELRRAGRLGS